ncbi:MAG: prepilin peptidase [Acidimicrobiia bacterium]
MGLAFGSFANVAIHRVPAGVSLSRPGSACPHCGTPIEWYDNIPVLSWIVLRGRCRNCKGPISIRYPIVELGTGLLWAAVAYRLGLVWELPAFLAFTTTLVILSVIDLEHKRLPNRVLGPSSLIAVVLLGAAAAATQNWVSAVFALGGALIYGLLILVIALIYPAGMGGGDVKFAPYLGFHLGWLGLGAVAVGVLTGFIAGGLAGVVLVVVRRAGRKDMLPFGPFMALGSMCAVLFGDELLRLWLGI